MSEHDGTVIGSIIPSSDVDGEPVFEVDGRLRGRWGEEDECDHLRYKLDEQWSKVTCRKCGAALEAFDVLLRYSEWEQDLRSRQRTMEAAERRMLTTSLRALKKRKATTEAEKRDITNALSGIDRYGAKGYVTTTESLRTMEHNLSRSINARRVRRQRS